MQDILALTRDIIALIKDNQVEAAKHLVTEAVRRHDEKSGKVLSEAIIQVNIKLQQMKEQRKLLRQTVQALPDKERIFAEVQIEAIVDKIYAEDIAGLKERKRALSRPAEFEVSSVGGASDR